MSGLYILYPAVASSGGGGTLSSISFSVGTLDGQAPTPQGGSVSSNSIFMQSATTVFPGLINSTSQTFSGVKTFNSAPILPSLSINAQIATNGSGQLVSSSVSLTSQVTGVLPLANITAIPLNSLVSTTGSISLTAQVSGVLPLSQTSPIPLNSLTSTTGSISLTGQVVGVLPNANMSSVALGTAAQVTGSISLTNQVVGNLPLSQTSGSISLTSQVVGNLPLSQTSGSVSFSQLQPYPQLTIGSVTHTSSTGGAAYTLSFPGAQGLGTQTLVNNGSGNLYWNNATGITKQVFTTAVGSGSVYITPAGCVALKVTVIGGGGGGGGCASSAASGGGGGGGGGGGAAIKWITAGAILKSYAYIVGAGGPGGSSGNNSGTNGSVSGFGGTTAGANSGFTLSGNGGNGGNGGASITGPAYSSGLVNGGTAVGGDIVITGGQGFPALVLTVSQVLSGSGGTSLLSMGAASIQTANAGGNGGTGYGGGGSGGGQISNGGTQTGGAGANGVVIVEEFYT